jgi:hypothetical protein
MFAPPPPPPEKNHQKIGKILMKLALAEYTNQKLLPPKQNRPVLIKKFYSQDKNQEIYG